MKKAAVFFLAAVMVFTVSACSYANGGRTRALRKELNALFEGENYYIREVCTYAGETSVREYTKLGELDYYGLEYDESYVKFMKTYTEYAIVDEAAKTATVYALDSESALKDEMVFDGEKKFLDALFTVTLNEGEYLGTVENDDKTVYENYKDSGNGSTWSFKYSEDGELLSVQNIIGGKVNAEYEFKFSTEGNINLFTKYEDYEIIEK